MRGVHDRLRAHLRRRLGPAASGWSTSRSSPSARCAASTIRPPSCAPPGPATTPGSTRSAPAATIAFLMECAEQGLDRRPARAVRAGPRGSATASSVLEAIAALLDRAGQSGRAAGPGQPPGRRADRRRGPGLAPHVKGLELPGLRPARPAHDGPGPGRRHPGRRPQPLGGLRGRLLQPHRPAARRPGVRRRRDRDRGPRGGAWTR